MFRPQPKHTFFNQILTRCTQRIRDLFIKRYINLHFTYLHTEKNRLNCRIDFYGLGKISDAHPTDSVRSLESDKEMDKAQIPFLRFVVDVLPNKSTASSFASEEQQ